MTPYGDFEDLLVIRVIKVVKVIKDVNAIKVVNLFCFNLGFALLQTDSSAPALPPEGGFGTPQ